MGRTVTRRRWLSEAAALAGGGAAVACSPRRPGDGAGQASGKAPAPVTIQIYENPLFPWKDDVGKTIVAPLLAANPWLTLDTSVPAGDVREKFVAATAAD